MAIAALAVLPTTAGARQAPRAPASSPVVVAELFTSEGCSSCPPADAVLRDLADGSLTPGIQVIALGEHVDYWDHEGWRDPFSSALFSVRQTAYDTRVFHANTIYTPQLIIDGQTQLIGSERAKVRAAVAAAARQPKVPLAVRARRSVDGSTIDVTVVGSAAEGPNDLVLAVTEDRLVTEVKTGENGGRVLSHTGVVRLLRSARVESGALSRELAVRFDRRWNPVHLSVVALLQDRASWRVIGAGSVPLGGAGTSH